MTVWRRVACLIIKATLAQAQASVLAPAPTHACTHTYARTHIHTEICNTLLFHDNSGFVYGPQCYVILTLTVAFKFSKYKLYFSRYSDYATGWMVQGSNPGRGKYFCLLPERLGRLWGPPGRLFNGYLQFYRGYSGQVKLSTLLDPVPNLRTSGTTPILPIYAFKTWTLTTLPSHCPHSKNLIVCLPPKVFFISYHQTARCHCP